MKIMRKYVWIGALCLAAAVVVLVLFYRADPSSKYSASNTPIEVLSQENTDYARARELVTAGKHAEAEEAYNAALAHATDYVQRGQIRMGIAQQKYRQGDDLGAVRLFKELIADSNNIRFLRAYAAQWIAFINEKADPEITEEIFSTEPYVSMRVEGDVALANRHLAEYASSIYPLGLTEMYIATWYAEKLTETPPPPEALAYVDIVKRKIENAEKDIKRAENDPGGRPGIPDILQNEAWVKGDLAIAGAGSVADAEAQFQRAFAAMTAYGKPAEYDQYARLHYAIFLMRMYGKGKSAGIHSTLSPLYESDVYKSASLVSFLKNIGSGGPVDPKKKKHIGQLANYDSGWKTYLLSLGWKESDFK